MVSKIWPIPSFMREAKCETSKQVTNLLSYSVAVSDSVVHKVSLERVFNTIICFQGQGFLKRADTEKLRETFEKVSAYQQCLHSICPRLVQGR